MNTQLRIDSLTVSNFRCFESLTIDFHPDLTVLVARNGQGKTAILDATKISLGTFTKAFPYSLSAVFKEYDARITEQGILPEPTYPVSVQATGLIDNTTCSWSRQKTKPDGVTSIGKTKSLIEYGKKLYEIVSTQQQSDSLHESFIERQELNLPVLAYYSTNRLWTDEKLKDKETKRISPLTESRFYAYKYAFYKQQNYSALKQWLKTALLFTRYSKTSQIESRGEIVIDQLDAIIKALTSVLQEEGVYDIDYDYSTYDLAALITSRSNEEDSMESLTLPVSKLSDGIRGVFAMVADLAWRCVKLNPHLGKDACKKTCGIVMIDEVDLCLHPAWQQRIIGDLRHAFPNIQFIVTTHSPQVVSSVPKECVRIISDGTVVPITKPTQGVDVSSILASIFNTDPIPQNTEIARKLDRLHALTAEGLGNTPEWNSIYNELEMYYGTDYGPLLGAKNHKDFLNKIKGWSKCTD